MVERGNYIFTQDPPQNPERRFKVVCADAVGQLRKIKSGKVHCILTSPPYFHAVDYGYGSQTGLEPTVERYIEKVSAVAKELLRVASDRAVMFWVIKDSN